LWLLLLLLLLFVVCCLLLLPCCCFAVRDLRQVSTKVGQRRGTESSPETQEERLLSRSNHTGVR